MCIRDRFGTRKYYTIAFFTALSSIGLLENKTFGYERYFEIPENKESHFDIIYRNVKPVSYTHLDVYKRQL